MGQEGLDPGRIKTYVTRYLEPLRTTKRPVVGEKIIAQLKAGYHRQTNSPLTTNQDDQTTDLVRFYYYYEGVKQTGWLIPSLIFLSL